MTLLHPYWDTSGSWPRVRARALCAPVFLDSLPRQTGRCEPPLAHRSFAASYSTHKNIYNLSNFGRPRQGLFSFHWTTEVMKCEMWNVPSPRPSQLRWSFRQYFWGEIMYRCDHTALFFSVFFLFSTVFGCFLFVLLFFFFSSFSSLLFNFFLFFSSYLSLFFS